MKKDNTPLLAQWPSIIAHRGASSLAPENTLAAFVAARQAGARAIELDVHLCASGDLVVIHDHWLDRLCALHRRVEEMKMSELSLLDVGSHFKNVYPQAYTESFSRERIPTLDQALETIGNDIFLDIELKLDSLSPLPLVHALKKCLSRHNRSRYIVSSFNPLALLAWKGIGGHTTAAIYCPELSVPFYMRHRECLYLSGADIKKPSLETALASPGFETGKKPVLVWTVDTPSTAKLLLEGGVSAIITNRIQDWQS